MRSLNPIEIENIQSTIAPLTSKKDIVALCAYGSHIADYATEKSDYDVIIVLKPFNQRVKYYYLKGETECSALVVHPKSFENDCKKSSLGEFISGRLLNPYFSIVGEEFLLENEISYKRRVILESVSEVYAENSGFTCEIVFPLSYFLYDKLRKRAAIYPPVVYSYAQTYGKRLLESNLLCSLSGFRRAAKLLQDEGVAEFDSEKNTIKFPSLRFHGGLAARLTAAASYTSKSITQYAVHGYAGRVKPNVVWRELMSKKSRSIKTGKLPPYILRPRDSWTIRAGKLIVSSDNWMSDLIKHLNMDENSTKIVQESLGEFYNSTDSYTLQDSNTKIQVAIKRFRDAKGIKWSFLSLWSLKNQNFTMNAMERMHREYHALLEFRKFGLQTPDVLALFLSHRILVTRFVKGKDLSRLESEFLDGNSDDLAPFTTFGRDLATIHNHGYCMGDTKPSNAILSDNDSRICFTDLEQANNSGNKTWDIAEFIYYSVRFTLKEDRARQLIDSFIQGYLETSHNPSVLKDCLAFRYRAPFQAFIAPNVMNVLKRDLANRSISAS